MIHYHHIEGLLVAACRDPKSHSYPGHYSLVVRCTKLSDALEYPKCDLRLPRRVVDFLFGAGTLEPGSLGPSERAGEQARETGEVRQGKKTWELACLQQR
jgi:hypothetical protein